MLDGTLAPGATLPTLVLFGDKDCGLVLPVIVDGVGVLAGGTLLGPALPTPVLFGDSGWELVLPVIVD